MRSIAFLEVFTVFHDSVAACLDSCCVPISSCDAAAIIEVLFAFVLFSTWLPANSLDAAIIDMWPASAFAALLVCLAYAL